MKNNSTWNRSAARKWMRSMVETYQDRVTGEVNLTEIVEGCAGAFGVDGIGGPLDDPDHWIWEVAVEVAP
jgi:hypothetical protein